ncbi:MAG: LexA family protein [Acidobacteriota bacterium]
MEEDLIEREEREEREQEVEDDWRLAMGFPSPADIYRQGRLDLNRYLVRHAAATFFARMVGTSLESEGVIEGDLLVVDRAEKVVAGSLMVVRVGEEMLVRKVEKVEGRLRLTGDGQDPLWLEPEGDWELWGRVIWSVRRH